MKRCECIKVDGVQCQYKAKPNSKYCGIHKNCKRPIELKSQFNLTDLPPEVVIAIIQKMSRDEIVQLRQSNKRLAKFIDSYNLLPPLPIGDRVKLADMFMKYSAGTYKYMSTHRFPDINKPYKRLDAQPVLKRALDRGTFRDIKYLLEHGADPNAFEKGGHIAITDALTTAYDNSTITDDELIKRIELLLHHGASVNTKINKYGGIPPLIIALIYYINNGGELWWNVVKLLLNNGAKVNYNIHSGQKIKGWRIYYYGKEVNTSKTILEYTKKLIETLKHTDEPDKLKRAQEIYKLLLKYE